MSTITKERIELFIKNPLENGITRSEQMEVARIALASLEADPIGEVSEKRYGLIMDGTVDLGGKSTYRIIKGEKAMKLFPLGTKFYTAPPAPVSVPAAMEIDDDFDSAFEHGKAVGWNAYRAAMLQAGNSPVAPDGWIPVSERVPPNKPGSYEYIVFDSLNNKAHHDYWNVPDGSCDEFTPFWNHYGNYVTHWMPLTAAPQQEVK
ncbi:DUF551 domain-containing protein [Citrobacter youngae]|nr:DUF551 domain-containing protein [Citrobacter youngae]